jgi:hypothetical protein
MSILYAVLVTLLVYPATGTLLFALIENFKISIRMKISIITFGHPLLAAIIIWSVCSTFNKEIAETGVLFVAGTLLRIPFSDKKYFSTVVKESGAVTIEYFSELLKRNTISLLTSEITAFTQSSCRNIFDKPSELTVSVSNQTLKFKILDKNTRINL